MKAGSIYSLETGFFTGHVISVPESEIAPNIPPGCALVEGSWPSDRWRVDLVTREVVSRHADRPQDTLDFVWEWSGELGKWVACATLRRERADRLALLDAAITTTEAGIDRALRDLVITAGFPVAAVKRMQAIEASVAGLRAVRQQLLDAATLEDLLAVELPGSV